MYNNLVTIGNIEIKTYGVILGIALFASFVALYIRLKNRELEYQKAVDIILMCIIPGFIGAKLNYYLVNIPDIKNDLSLLNPFQTGLVIYGGVIFGIISCYTYLRLKKMDIAKYMDITVASVPLAQCIGRLGCFMSGCCYGVYYEGPLHVTFPTESLAPSGNLLPTQLIFSLADLINFFILCINEKKDEVPGRTVILYMITYGFGRFLLEFLRGDSVRGEVLGMSTAQFTSIFMSLVGCILYAYVTHRYEKNKEKTT